MYFLLSNILLGCFYFTDPLSRMEKVLAKGQCQKAYLIFRTSFQNYHSVKRQIQLAEKSGRVCLKKNPKLAMEFYQYLIHKPLSLKKKIIIHQKLVFLAELMNQYKQAEVSYLFLIYYHKKKSDFYRYSFSLAQLYFNSQKWEKSLQIIKEASHSWKKNFLKSIKNQTNIRQFYLDFLFLKARVFLMKKEFTISEKIFLQVKKRDLKYFNQHDGGFYLAFLYEKRKAFDQAVFVLKDQPSSHFLKQEIQRLKIRQKNQPRSKSL